MVREVKLLGALILNLANGVSLILAQHPKPCATVFPVNVVKQFEPTNDNVGLPSLVVISNNSSLRPPAHPPPYITISISLTPLVKFKVYENG